MNIKVEPNKLEELSAKLKHFDRTIEAGETGIHKELNRLINETNAQYNEDYVRAATSEIYYLLQEVRTLASSVTERLTKSSTTLNQAADRYRQDEKKIERLFENRLVFYNKVENNKLFDQDALATFRNWNAYQAARVYKTKDSPNGPELKAYDPSQSVTLEELIILKSERYTTEYLKEFRRGLSAEDRSYISKQYSAYWFKQGAIRSALFKFIDPMSKMLDGFLEDAPLGQFMNRASQESANFVLGKDYIGTKTTTNNATADKFADGLGKTLGIFSPMGGSGIAAPVFAGTKTIINDVIGKSYILLKNEDGFVRIPWGNTVKPKLVDDVQEVVSKGTGKLDYKEWADMPVGGQVKLAPNGQRLISIRDLKLFTKDMKGKGIKVAIDEKGKILPDFVAGGFDPRTGQIVLKKDPAYLSAMHESYHAKQWLEIGKEKYLKLSTLEREEYVYNQIMKNKDLYTSEEILFSQRYIYKLRNGEWPPPEWKGSE